MMGIRWRIAISCARTILRMVSGDHDDFPSLDYAEAGDDSGGGCLTVVLVVGDEESDLEPRASRVQQLLDSLARRQLTLLVHLRDALGSPALPQPGSEGEVLITQSAQTRSSRDGLGSGHRSVLEVFRGPGLDVADEIRSRSAGSEQAAHPPFFESIHVFLGNDYAPGDQDVGAALLIEQLTDPGK